VIKKDNKVDNSGLFNCVVLIAIFCISGWVFDTRNTIKSRAAWFAYGFLSGVITFACFIIFN